MSRCLPYPPPGYVRNPVAVAVAEAESTAKLQKERGKAEKKKEKRNDKKTIQHGEASKHSKHSHKKRKHDDASTAGQESKKVSQGSGDQLEKSGLSEEHGAPCFMQTIQHSPESSQDSSKRRKVLPSPSQAKNGNILRIKIKSNPDSPAAVLEKPRVIDQPLVEQMGSSSFLSGKQSSIQKNNNVNVRSTSATQQRMNGYSQALQERLSTGTSGKIMQGVAPQTVLKARQPIGPQLSVKAPVGRSDIPPPKFSGSVNLSPVREMGRLNPLPAKPMPRVQPPSVNVLQKVEPQLPSEEIQRKSPEFITKVAHKGTVSVVRLPEAPQLPLLQKPIDLLLPKPLEPIAPVPKEEPCSSGRDVKAVPVKVKLSRSERKKIRKAEKKEKKIRDLFVTWNPVSTEMVSSDLGEQDWLLSGARNSDGSSNNCRTSGFVPIHSMEQQPSLQPRAILLPDLNIFQMPYVIPF